MIEGQFTRIQSTSYLCQTSDNFRICSECTSMSVFQCPTCCAGPCHLYLIFVFLLHFCPVFQCPAWRGCVVPAGCCHLYFYVFRCLSIYYSFFLYFCVLSPNDQLGEGVLCRLAVVIFICPPPKDS